MAQFSNFLFFKNLKIKFIKKGEEGDTFFMVEEGELVAMKSTDGIIFF